MKNILGIIAEYNPLHNGHMYHIKEAQKKVKPDFTIAIISGNFTQRGTPSIVNKWEKAKMALNAGIDIVVELPTIYSISSAENFADGAIKILKQMGTTHISFGMEADNIEDLSKIADILCEEPKELSNIIKSELKKGISYPKARQKAILEYSNNEKYEKIVSEPNNILAIEYLKSIKKHKAQIIPIGIKRNAVMHNSDQITNKLASSTAIRKILENEKIEKIKEYVPESSFKILEQNIENGTYIKNVKKYEKMIIYKLRTMSTKQIADLPDVSEGLENLISKSAGETNSITELIEKIKSKRYTQTKIQRILMYALIGINKKDMEISGETTPYIRILGMNEQSKKHIKNIEKNGNVIISVKEFEKNNKNEIYRKLHEIDKKATDIYSIGFEKNSKASLDYTTRIITKTLQ